MHTGADVYQALEEFALAMAACTSFIFFSINPEQPIVVVTYWLTKNCSCVSVCMCLCRYVYFLSSQHWYAYRYIRMLRHVIHEARTGEYPNTSVLINVHTEVCTSQCPC